MLTFTDRRNELAGVLQSATGLPAPDYSAVALPADRALWQANSRRVQPARSGTDGAFSIRDLPAGSYLFAALTDLEPADLTMPSFLEQLAAQAVPVTVRDGERTVQTIRIAGGS